MSPAAFNVCVITPKGVEFESAAVHIRFPDERGFVGVLAHHAPLISASPGGRMDIKLPDGREKTMTVGAGFFEVARNRAVFLTQSCMV